MKMKLILLKKKIIHFLMNTSQKNIKQFGPELDDLYRLHQIVLKFKRVTILEFGIGWSTKIFANALIHNKKKFLSKVKKVKI